MSRNDPDELDRKLGRDDVEETIVASVGIGTRGWRSIWHSLVHTPRVVEAAIIGDRSDYISPIAVFFPLFGLQFLVAALFGAPTSPNLDMLLQQGVEPSVIQGWLDGASSPVSVEALNQRIDRFYSLSMWPLIVVSFLPYLVLLKLYRLRRSLFAHTLTYLVTVNAMLLVQTVALPVSLLGSDVGSLILLSISLLVYFVATARALSAHYARHWWSLTLMIVGIVFVAIISLILITIANFVVADFAVRPFGLSFFELMTIAYDTDPSGSTP